MILRLLADAPEDVSVGINTLTMYVPDRTHLKLKAIKLNTSIGFLVGKMKKTIKLRKYKTPDLPISSIYI